MKIELMRAACFAVVFSLTGFGVAHAAPKTMAVFGLYEAAASAALKVDRGIADRLGCDVLRIGRIVAQDGDIGLPKPDAFVMLACSKPVLEPSGAVLDQLVKGAKRIAFFEGGLDAAAPQDAGKTLAERQYIVKVSTFNHADPKARARDLAEVNGLVAKRPDPFHPEANIDVTGALGARRPDEVSVMYYDDGKAGDRFRTGNPDIMQLIGQFNTRHVGGFIYYVGMAQD